MKNQRKIMSVAGWREKYPAFAWCAGLGDGWYLPAIEELEKFTLDDAVHDAVNRTLLQYGGKTLFNEGDCIKWYWSSSEHNEYIEFAWNVDMLNGSTDDHDKLSGNFVRAVSAF